MRLAVLLLVACSTRSIPDAGVANPAPAAPDAPPARRGAHGAAIELVAITDDGSAVLTQDATGGARLWPRLDGTEQPVVVHLPQATSVALGRDGEGFVVAALDEGGGLELVRIAASGQVSGRASIAPDPAIESIAIGAQGIYAVRADQTIAILGAGGEQVAVLPAPAATRLRSVVTRGEHALALIEDGDKLRAQWIDGTAWGAELPAFASPPTSTVALSPDGTLLLYQRDSQALLVDARTGRELARHDAVAIGFTDGRWYVMAEGGKVWWYEIQAGSEAIRGFEEAAVSSSTLAVGNGRVVSAHAMSLMLHTRQRVEYLGYRSGSPVNVHPLGERLMVSTGDQRPLLLDGALAPQEALQLPDDMRTLYDAVPIDDRFVIATHTIGGGSWWSLSVLDRDESKTVETMTAALKKGEIGFDPATQLLEVSDNVATFLVRWDATHHMFDPWYRLDRMGSVSLLDPARADGLVALVTPVTGALDVAEYSAASLQVGEPIGPRATYQVAGYFVTSDASGVVYSNDHGDLVATRHGLEQYRITEVGSVSVAPHPSGAYIVVWDNQRISLYEHGVQRWAVAAPLVKRVMWLGDELVAEYEGGIGKIDAATGALIDRVCGWSFGLSALPANDPAAGDSICDAL